MISLKAKNRKEKGKNSRKEEGLLPAVLYGPGIESISLLINKKDFDKIYKEVGETLIDIDVDGSTYSVLIYDTQFDPMTSEVMHVDFYQPNLKEEVETEVPLELSGEAPALKLGGTLITNMKELAIKALPKDLPSKIKIDVSSLKTFEDVITIKDIIIPKGVKVLGNLEDVVVQVVEPEKVEEELAKPIEEVTKEPEKAGEKKEEEPAAAGEEKK
jgi:large subunit ribosomal protein L25